MVPNPFLALLKAASLIIKGFLALALALARADSKRLLGFGRPIDFCNLLTLWVLCCPLGFGRKQILVFRGVSNLIVINA